MPEDADFPESEFIDPLIGTMIGRYRVERGIGQGGMGSVYELLQPAIHKRMALKLLHEEYAERPEIVRRFFDEARAVNLIGHPNIVDITDFSHLPDGRPFIIMEHLDGLSLEDYLDQHGPLAPDLVVEILRQLCSALGAAHDKTIVHRDLKPENIFLLRHPDDSLQVKVLDFGIAKLRSTAPDEDMATDTGVVLGTPTYMSPEQAKGDTHSADHRTDIYSLGVMTYQMLVGVPPFKGASFAELILKHIHHSPPTVSSTRHDLPPAWDALSAKAMAKDPSERFQSMHALYEAATAALAQPAVPVAALAQVESPSQAQSKSKKRGLWLAAPIVLLAALALLWFAGAFDNKVHPEPEPVTGPVLLNTQSQAEQVAQAPPAPADAGQPDAAPVSDAAPAPKAAPEAKPTGFGTLIISADPWATVYVDGKSLGQTPFQREISAGRHRVRLKNGSTGQITNHRITIKKGATATIRERW